MPDYIKRLIAGGEHQTLDFKFEVSDFRKIARTLVAFSNTDGGRLLVGVKDNGAIAGIRSEEEYFMIDGAARIYCRPEVRFHAREWKVEGKRVMEVIIERGKNKPYLAQDEDNRWIAYIRQGDQNFKANKILLRVWDHEKSGQPATIRFRQAERMLLAYLEENKSITISRFRRLAGLSMIQAENILIDFILPGLIEMEHTSTNVIFRLTPGYQAILEELDQDLYKIR
jgi:predicted HTH transcriptional regulator